MTSFVWNYVLQYLALAFMKIFVFNGVIDSDYRAIVFVIHIQYNSYG